MWKEFADQFFRFESNHLIRNIHAKNVEAVRFLINKNGIDPSWDDHRAIYYASAHGSPDIVKILLMDERVDPSMVSLNSIFQGNHVGVLEVLMEDPRFKKVDLSDHLYIDSSEMARIALNGVTNPSGTDNALLKFACTSGDLDLLEILLNDERITNEMVGPRPIDLAAINGHLLVVAKLLEDPRFNDLTDETFLNAVTSGNLDLIEMLLEDPRVDPSCRLDQALRYCASEGRLEVLMMLMRDSRCDPSVLNNKPIIDACYNGHEEIVELLLTDSRVDPRARGQKCLIESCFNGKAGIVEILLGDPRVDPTIENQKPLRAAHGEGYDEIVALLMAHPSVDPSCIFGE